MSEAASERPSERTPVAIWILYVLGILSGLVLVGSGLVVAIESVASRGNGVDLHVSTAALAVWLVLALAAGATFVWRRWGRGQ